MLAHLDRNPDPGLHRELAAAGAWLSYDGIGRIKYGPDSAILGLIDAVGPERVLLGGDQARRSEHPIDWLFTPLRAAARPRRRGAAPRRRIRPRHSRGVDVLVVGAGSAGSTAAIAAARTGARTLLVDRLGFLGGTSTAVLDTFYAFYTPGQRPREGRRGDPGRGRRAASSAEGAAFERPNTYGAGTGITYDPETLKRVWETLVLEAGADVLLHSFVHGVDRRRRHASPPCGSGRRAASAGVEARVVVDASGDADVCHLAGAPYERPARAAACRASRRSSEWRTSTSARAEAVPKAGAVAADAGGVGLRASTRCTRLEGSVHRTPQAGVMMALMTRMRDVDATDPEQLTRAEIEGRRQCREYFRFLRERVPGYERAVLVSTSPAIGVRESRRILGEHVLTAEEILAAHAVPGPDRAVRRADRGSPRRLRHALGLPRRGRELRHPLSRAAAAGVDERRRRRPLLLGDARRARLGPQHGYVHGDGPGGGHGGGARGGGRRAVSAVDPAGAAGAAAGGRRRCRRLSAICEDRFVAILRRPPDLDAAGGGARRGRRRRARDHARHAAARSRRSRAGADGRRCSPGRCGRRPRPTRGAEAGAEALVSPCSPTLVFLEHKVPRVPGAFTPTRDRDRPGERGAPLVKLFPAGSLGARLRPLAARAARRRAAAGHGRDHGRERRRVPRRGRRGGRRRLQPRRSPSGRRLRSRA